MDVASTSETAFGTFGPKRAAAEEREKQCGLGFLAKNADGLLIRNVAYAKGALAVLFIVMFSSLVASAVLPSLLQRANAFITVLELFLLLRRC